MTQVSHGPVIAIISLRPPLQQNVEQNTPLAGTTIVRDLTNHRFDQQNPIYSFPKIYISRAYMTFGSLPKDVCRKPSHLG